MEFLKLQKEEEKAWDEHVYKSNSGMAKKKISIIGSGWVGTAIGKGFTGIGYEVIFYDVIDKHLPNFTKNINYAIENSDISFISVPTPTAPNGIDLSYVKKASENIGKALSSKDDYHLVVVKSTVVPGTTEKVVIPILEKYSGKRARDDEIGVCMNPEFLTEISGSWSKDKGYKKDFFTKIGLL